MADKILIFPFGFDDIQSKVETQESSTVVFCRCDALAFEGGEMISRTGNLNPYAFSFPRGGVGKLYVPVKPATVIFAQYDHVSGFAARRGEQGVSLSKVQILNTLISHLSTIKGDNAPKPRIDVFAISDKQIDAIIDTLQQQVKTTVTAPQARYALSGAQPATGALFSINA